LLLRFNNKLSNNMAEQQLTFEERLKQRKNQGFDHFDKQKVQERRQEKEKKEQQPKTRSSK